MPSREDARETAQYLRSLVGGDDVTRLAAARVLSRLSPIDATELLQESIVLAREGDEAARVSVAAFARALEREAAQIPYAPQLRRIARLSAQPEVETMLAAGAPAQEYDEGESQAEDPDTQRGRSRRNRRRRRRRRGGDEGRRAADEAQPLDGRLLDGLRFRGNGPPFQRDAEGGERGCAGRHHHDRGTAGANAMDRESVHVRTQRGHGALCE